MKTLKVDEIASNWGFTRKWSPVKTEECPIEDFIKGGYCESDNQLRARIARELMNEE